MAVKDSPETPPQPYRCWESQAKWLICDEMQRQGIGYKKLALLLQALGVEESAEQINRKVNRQRFSAAFLLACMQALGMRPVFDRPK